jgi:2'-5' RNA ligase
MPERCFVALELPERTVPALTSAGAAFRAASPGWREEKWVAPRLLHVTLAFLGPVPDAGLGAVLGRLRQVGERNAPFTLRLSGARATPSAHHAAMVWASLDGDVDDATALRDEVLRAAGCGPDQRPFIPHVTLVRSRRPQRVHHDAITALADSLRDLGKTPDGVVSVPSLTVLASALGAAGPTYSMLGVVPLKGASSPASAD